MSDDTDDARYPVTASDQRVAQGAGPDAIPRRAAGATPNAHSPSKYWDHWADGSYRRRRLRQVLFQSDAKFDAGCGWPELVQRNQTPVASSGWWRTTATA